LKIIPATIEGMANRRYPNLTIINEIDLHINDSNAFDNAVIAKLPLSATDAIGHQSIRNAIQQQFQLDMQVEDILKFGMDYFIKVNSSDASARMLDTILPQVAPYNSASAH
jgi:hypothetical protein